MRTNNGGRNVREEKLFHGTNSGHVDAICLTNFDWRICGTHGTAFGTGAMKKCLSRASNFYLFGFKHVGHWEVMNIFHSHQMIINTWQNILEPYLLLAWAALVSFHIHYNVSSH